MPMFLCISRHTPENCPIFNAKTRKAYVDFASKIEGITKKHGIKILWGGGVESEHLSVMAFEAPSLEAFQKFGMEPEILALGATETMEIKLAMSMEEATKMLEQLK
jgi:hypothetical protein